MEVEAEAEAEALAMAAACSRSPVSIAPLAISIPAAVRGVPNFASKVFDDCCAAASSARSLSARLTFGAAVEVADSLSLSFGVFFLPLLLELLPLLPAPLRNLGADLDVAFDDDSALCTTVFSAESLIHRLVFVVARVRPTRRRKHTHAHTSLLLTHHRRAPRTYG